MVWVLLLENKEIHDGFLGCRLTEQLALGKASTLTHGCSSLLILTGDLNMDMEVLVSTTHRQKNHGDCLCENDRC